MKKNILDLPVIIEMKRTTANMYRLGWHERNAGNISVLLDEKDICEYLDLNRPVRNIPLGFCAKGLKGKVFLVTGTGKYFKNIEFDPEENLGIVKIAEDGKSADLLWGLKSGGKFTSEFPTHLMCHTARLESNPNHRLIMHAHPLNLVAMSYIHPITEREFTRTLWQMCIEAVLIFPQGLGILPWMLCGTTEIGEATAAKMREFNIVLWALHGVFSSGNNLDEAFGLIETAEKGAEIYLKTLNRPLLLKTTDSQIRVFAELWNAKYRKEWLDE